MSLEVWNLVKADDDFYQNRVWRRPPSHLAMHNGIWMVVLTSCFCQVDEARDA